MLLPSSSLCCRKCYFLSFSFPVRLLPSQQNNMLFTNHGVILSDSSLLSPSVLPYIFFPVCLDTLLQVLLIFHFLRSFDPNCRPVYLMSLCMRSCFLVYIGILVPIRSFLAPGGGTFASTCRNSTGKVMKAFVYVLMPSLCMLFNFFNLPAEALS